MSRWVTNNDKETMAIIYKDINQLTQKSSVAGTEKIPVSDTEYITPSQIAREAGTKVYEYSVTSFDSASITSALPNNFYLTLKADIDNGLVPIIKLISASNDEVALVFDMYYGSQKHLVFSSADKYYVCTLLVEYNRGSYNKYTYSEIQPQERLVSGTNIKTINNQSLLGSGDIPISGGGGDTSDCVHITGDETVGGDKTFTDNIAVVDASHILYSGASPSQGFTRGTSSQFWTGIGSTLEVGSDEALAGEPKAFIISARDVGTGVLMVVGDSTGVHGIYNTGSQHNYSSSFTKSYSNGILTITAPTGVTFGDYVTYDIVYYYGDGTLTFKTSTIQPGSGVTAVTFTGTDLTEVPAIYACFLETAVNNEQYRRVAGYTNSAYSGSAVSAEGITFLTGGPVDTTSSFSVSYNNGLLINSGGTNAGGYFHNPGTYTLYYLMASDIGGGGSGSYNSLKDELDGIRNTISGIETLLAAI